jgi:plastocyanin
MPKRLFLLPIALCALAATGCGSSGNSSSSSASSTPQQVTKTQPSSSVGSGKGVKVDMQNIAFSPSSVTVKVGQTVTWVNKDSVQHNVTTQSGASFKSKNFGQGGTYAFKVTKPGTIKYVCTLHPGMDGTLIVTK